MLKDELDEQREHEESYYPTTSSLPAGEPFTGSKKIAQIKETRDTTIQATHFMVVDEATRTKIEQELAKNKGVTSIDDNSEKEEETIEEKCGVSDLHGHLDSSKL